MKYRYTRKRCSCCKKEKQIGDFSKNKSQKDGLKNYCKECDNLWQRIWNLGRKELISSQKKDYYKKNFETIKEKTRKYSKSPEGKISRLKTARKMIAKYPEKYKARARLKYAIMTGKIKKQPCAECGSLTVHGHHLDYSKPLEVVWLCPLHHRLLEGKQKYV